MLFPKKASRRTEFNEKSARFSLPPKIKEKNQCFKGFVKFYLAHSLGRSYFLPQFIFAVAETRFYVPTFFSPPLISFNVVDGIHIVKFSVDIGPPREKNITRALIEFRSDERVKSYSDGAQLYSCSIEVKCPIVRLASGLCSRMPDGDFSLIVYHHTSAENARKIEKSGELWASAWNLAGTSKHENVRYVYLTTLSQIKDEYDLRLIAMSSEGELNLQTTSPPGRSETLKLKVYRDNASGRTSSLEFSVASNFIAPPHVYFHPFFGSNPAYYEVVGPDVLRIGLNLSEVAKFNKRKIVISNNSMKKFDHVILGDASTLAGLESVYSEEKNTHVALLEKLDEKNDIFDFWLKHQNTDLVTDCSVDSRLLQN